MEGFKRFDKCRQEIKEKKIKKGGQEDEEEKVLMGRTMTNLFTLDHLDILVRWVFINERLTRPEGAIFLGQLGRDS